nr:unnamed protein product [Naegleria fowleri]
MYHFRLLVFTCLLVLLLPHHLFLGWICCSSKVDPCDGINCDNNHGTRFNDVYSSVLPQTQQDLSTITVDNSPKAIPVNVYLLSARDAYKYGVKEIALSVTIMAQQPETALVRADSKVNNEMDSMAEFSIVATVKQHDTLKNILLVFDRFISNVNKRMMRKTNAMLPLSYRCSRYDVNAFTFSVLVGEQVFQGFIELDIVGIEKNMDKNKSSSNREMVIDFVHGSDENSSLFQSSCSSNKSCFNSSSSNNDNSSFSHCSMLP